MAEPPSKLSLRGNRPEYPGNGKPQAGQLAGRRVLVVDDNPVNVGVLVGILKTEQCIPISSPNGQSALDLAAEHLPSLILLDIMMPQMDGFAVCRELKRNPLTSAIPVIFVTALNDQETKEKARAMGAVDFIEKPISRKNTLDRIRKVLSHAPVHTAASETLAAGRSTGPQPVLPAVSMAKKTSAPVPADSPADKAPAKRAPDAAAPDFAGELDLLLRWGLHDIKGAFGGVVGLMDALSQEVENNETEPDLDSIREYIGWIKEALRNADEATAALGFLRNLPKQPLTPVDSPVYSLILTAAETLREGSRAAIIDLHEEQTLPIFRHDRELLGGLFLHLISALHDLIAPGDFLRLAVRGELTRNQSLQLFLTANGRSLHPDETSLFFALEKNGERRSVRGVGLSTLAVQRALAKLKASAKIEPLNHEEGNRIEILIPPFSA